MDNGICEECIFYENPLMKCEHNYQYKKETDVWKCDDWSDKCEWIKNEKGELIHF